MNEYDSNEKVVCDILGAINKKKEKRRMLFASGSRKLLLKNRVEGCVGIGIEEMSGGTIAIPKTDSDYYGEY